MPDPLLLPRLSVDLAQLLLHIEEILETIEARQLVMEQRLARMEAQSRTDHYGVGRGGLPRPAEASMPEQA